MNYRAATGHITRCERPAGPLLSLWSLAPLLPVPIPIQGNRRNPAPTPL